MTHMQRFSHHLDSCYARWQTITNDRLGTRNDIVTTQLRDIFPKRTIKRKCQLTIGRRQRLVENLRWEGHTGDWLAKPQRAAEICKEFSNCRFRLGVPKR